MVFMDISKPINQHWYLVYSKPRQELGAKANLERQGYKVFLPLLRCKKRIQGKVEFRIEALFPRYLFIQLTEGIDSYAPIRSTIGVSHLVKFGEELAHVPERLISMLCQQVNDGGVIEAVEKKIQVGNHCFIASGVMQGYEAIVLARTGKERVRVMLGALEDSNFAIDIAEDELELIA